MIQQRQLIIYAFFNSFRAPDIEYSKLWNISERSILWNINIVQHGCTISRSRPYLLVLLRIDKLAKHSSIGISTRSVFDSEIFGNGIFGEKTRSVIATLLNKLTVHYIIAEKLDWSHKRDRYFWNLSIQEENLERVCNNSSLPEQIFNLWFVEVLFLLRWKRVLHVHVENYYLWILDSSRKFHCLVTKKYPGGIFFRTSRNKLASSV